MQFSLPQQDAQYKTIARDFLIQLKEFAADDEQSDLYLEEKELAAQQRAQAEHAHAMSVPGMIKPELLQDQDEQL